VKHNTAVVILLAIAFAGTAARSQAEDVCTDFKWDVARERALFGEPATSLKGGTDLKGAPEVVPNRLYQLQLTPQDRVSFAAAPGNTVHAAGAFAGLASLRVPGPGSYRVSIDSPAWIDVVANGSLVQPRDYQGQHGCKAPRKIVEFDLVGAQPFVLQLSSSSPDIIRLTITASPTRKL
jgi:hypothetical protein